MPLVQVSVEYAQFDMQKLENPQIEAAAYQNGRMKGYGNASEYVRCRDKHTCQLCGKRDGKLEVHHVVWREHGGSDVPENMVTLCEKCHAKVHKNAKAKEKLDGVFQGLAKHYAPTTLLNTIMPVFYDWLISQFPQVSKTYGYETKAKRFAQEVPKRHSGDAYLASLGEQDVVHSSFSQFVPYEFSQFRRHNRQLIYAMRDRNYKLDNKIVAKNRHKKTGQLTDSLAELLVDKEASYHHCLRIYPGTKVHRSKFDQFRRGDTVLYQKRISVVKGYGEMGRSLGFVAHKEYVPAKNCSLLTKNTGIVCL